ncbi:MAG TPA: LacI family DNA-binding transcriptional regulator [Nakamurella multipartita]|nr:LacI family DNA-binding transcriptional regulator [Nakamurella multipartita]
MAKAPTVYDVAERAGVSIATVSLWSPRTPFFFAMHLEPGPAYDNLSKLMDLGAHGEGGFDDSVAVRSRTVAKRYLSLDQA